ncbi:hypothetical protein AB0J80_24915 [Actinoplanes sp. NPDC049548]
MKSRRPFPIGPLAIALRHRGGATPHRVVLLLTALAATTLAAGALLLPIA